MTALLVTLGVLAAIGLPFFAAGVSFERSRYRRRRGGPIAIRPRAARSRAPAREVIRETQRALRQPGESGVSFGDNLAGEFPRSEP